MLESELKNEWLGIADGKLIEIDEDKNKVLQAIPKGAKDILLIRGIIIDPGRYHIEAQTSNKSESKPMAKPEPIPDPYENTKQLYLF